MEIKRESFDYLFDLLSSSNPSRSVILLEGARQVGKTFLAKAVLAHAAAAVQALQVSFNLETDKTLRDDIDHCASFEAFTALLSERFGFDPARPALLYIDEAQESRQLGGFVRSMKEEWPRARTLLSGSSMHRLFSEDVRIPVGRMLRFVLQPFSFREFLAVCGRSVLLEMLQAFPGRRRVEEPFHTELLREVDAYLTVGGLPEAAAAFAQQQDCGLVRRSLLLNQEDDFLRKEGVNLLHLFRDCMRGVATHMGGPSKLSHVSERAGESRRVLNQMQAWHLVIEVEQRGTNVSTGFHPKRYMYDLGIAHDVRAAPFPRLSVLRSLSPVLRTDLGGLLENFVLLELNSHKLGRLEISSWRKNNKEPVEVDFVVQGERPIPIECKSVLKVTPRVFQYVVKYLELTGLDTGIVISAAPYQELRARGKRLINLPLYLCHYDVISALVGDGGGAESV